MSNVITRLLLRSEFCEPAVFTADEVADWPKGELEAAITAGLLVGAEAPSQLPCLECDQQPLLDIVFLGRKTEGVVAAYLPCPYCGPVHVPFARLRQWRLDFHRLLELVFGSTIATFNCREIIPRRLWNIGRAKWANCYWSVAVARSLHRRDGQELLRQTKLPPRSVIFTPAYLPRCDRSFDLPLPVIPLLDVLSWNGQQIAFDQTYVEGQLAAAIALSGILPSRPVQRKRAERAATIELLTKFLKQHIEAARDHARATANHKGLAELLPRPSQRDLAKLAGLSEVAVSRCLKDSSARELRLLWQVAGDLDQVLELRAVRS